MRIVFDLQGAQAGSRHRGIAKYTLAFAKGLASTNPGHELFFLLNSRFAESTYSIRKELRDLVAENQIIEWRGPSTKKMGLDQTPVARIFAEAAREQVIQALRPDIVHISSFLELGEEVVTIPKPGNSSKYLITVTFYDLIPLLNQSEYLLPGSPFTKNYLRAIEELKQADLLFAISEFSKSEGMTHLEISEDRIVSILPGADTRFDVLQGEKSSTQVVLKNYGIAAPFILYTGGGDRRKNLDRLINAYSRLPTDVRSSISLVLAGKLDVLELDHYQQAVKKLKLPSQSVIFTGYVSDSDLSQLYSSCEFFIFPSWHEGFGLPALEAMQHGSAVIGAGNTSLREIIEIDEALFRENS
jgi:glycosyltransferase involved in cell wall biosynthesis